MSTNASAAGKSENKAHTMESTEDVMEAGSMTGLPNWSFTMWAPAKPSSMAMREPEIAEPNFCAIVPEEKMSPVEDVPFFFVA